MSGGAICGGYAFEDRRIMFCPVENRRRRSYGTFAHWYGWTSTCLGCGDTWSDGEMHERPFARGWRKESISRAKAGWNRVTGTRRSRRVAFREMLAREFETVA